MLSDRLKRRVRRGAEYVARGIARTGLSPDALTILGFLLNVLVAAIIASGQQLIGGTLVLLVGAFDILDGALARVTQRMTTFGAFLDSTIDRYSEAVIYFGLLVLYAGRGHEALLIYAVIVGSLMVSYTRARAEGLGLRCEVGLFARPERVILLGLGLLLNQVYLTLWVLAILVNLTAVQRVLYVWRTTRPTR
ncbi:MAG: CDP-alcohol phosphatidyltransferase family protein [Chloroflexi bacterium]|nr:CDP-alcohol phosphatidyltransferase family protein [Chloroflexota bacterium]MCL5075137.1 CDP-alcohol phosphatidyltransferase family protein [Chloroflexota bacterium]